MTRFKLAIAVFAILGMIETVELAANLPGPQPSHSRFANSERLTPEKMNSIREREHREKQYAVAEIQARRVLVANGCADTYAKPIARAATDSHLPSRVVAAMVFVESSCNPLAVSPAGARGLAQINPRVWHHSVRELQDPETNIRIGTAILHRYVRESGLREGLHRFNGLGNASNTYADRVLEVAYAVQK